MTALAKLPELPEMSTLARMNVAGSDDVILVLGYTAEQMDAYVRAALSPAELGGVDWLPIDSCPDDGSRFLVLKDCGPGSRSSVSVGFKWKDNPPEFDDGCRTFEGYGYRVRGWQPLPMFTDTTASEISP